MNKKGTEQTFYAVNARLYEEYYANSFTPKFLNDIAVLTLDREPIINENVKFAPLATSIKWNNEAGLTPTVAGWGSTSNFGGYTPVLNEVNVTIKPINECAKRYEERNPQDSYICTELSTKDSCTVSLLVRHGLDFWLHTKYHFKFQGDSGGPLNCQVSGSNHAFEVCGITSFGKKGKCGVVKQGKNPNYPVYTNVGFYKDWINESTCEITFHFSIANI